MPFPKARQQISGIMGPKQQNNQEVTSYPFLTVDEWSGACTSFAAACSGLVGESSGWSTLSHHRSVDVPSPVDDMHGGTKQLCFQHGTDYLRMTRAVLVRTIHGSADGEEQDAYTISEECGGALSEESDHEELIVSRKVQPSSRAEAREPVKNTLNVTYDILLSPSYRVPVLHFDVRDACGSPVTDHTTILTGVVPTELQGQVADVGVIGGISMTDHPVTGLPSFFVHPCNTADALRQVAAQRSVSVPEYLFLWMGIVPPAVELSLPAALLARHMETSSAPIYTGYC